MQSVSARFQKLVHPGSSKPAFVAFAHKLEERRKRNNYNLGDINGAFQIKDHSNAHDEQRTISPTFHSLILDIAE
jgi:hypothetical protein